MTELSIIVPAYNEEKRISPFLVSLLKYCSSKLNDSEVIVVNDGSKDKTKDVISSLIWPYGFARLISYKVNKGKGGAVREGVMSSKGKYVLFIDADGSTAPDQIPGMLAKLKEGYDVVVGTRGMSKKKVIASPLRQFIGILFNVYVNMLYWVRIEDNLCGFKGFKKDVARKLFKDLIDRRWVFDVELFYKIRKKNYKLYELPIRWVHKKGTKIRMIDPLLMAWRLIVLRFKLIGYS